MKIKIKSLIYIQIYLVLFMGILTTQFHFPTSLKYVIDFINIILFIGSWNGIKHRLMKTRMKQSIVMIAVFFLFCSLTALLNGVNVLLFLWAVRVTFRFFMFYICCIVVLSKNDITKIFKQLEIIYCINFVIILIQNIIFGYSQDFLGGIFGVEQGCNGQLNVFVILILGYELTKYFDKKIKINKLMFFVLTAFVIAAVSELKVIFIEVVVLFAMALLLDKPSLKTFSVIIALVIGIIIGLNVLKIVFPESYKFFFDENAINNYLTASWIKGIQVTRLTGFKVINNYFFRNNFFRKIFGFGFGSCESSAFFSSEFAQKYSYTAYRQFSFAMEYLETGIVGLILYISCFISILICIARAKISTINLWMKKYAYIIFPQIILLIWYNDSIKTEVGYLVLLVFSMVGIVKRQEN